MSYWTCFRSGTTQSKIFHATWMSHERVLAGIPFWLVYRPQDYPHKRAAADCLKLLPLVQCRQLRSPIRLRRLAATKNCALQLWLPIHSLPPPRGGRVQVQLGNISVRELGARKEVRRKNPR